jgi:hypothetical protein
MRAIAWIATLAVACSPLVGADFDVRLGDRPAATIVGDDGGAAAPLPERPHSDGICAADRKRCGDMCVSRVDPAFGCGAADCDPCSAAHGKRACSVAGACAVASCESGYADCNGAAEDGCEASTTNDPARCGACDRACQGSLVCQSGACTSRCDPGLLACDRACVDPTNDENHCNDCATRCGSPQNGIGVCRARVCVTACNEGFHACGAECKPDKATSCGPSCVVCPVPAHSKSVSCTNSACSFACEPHFVAVGDSCQPASTCLRDADGDTFGDPKVTLEVAGACPAGYVPDGGQPDCFDGDAKAKPGQTEFFGVGYMRDGELSFDYDCDGIETQPNPFNFPTEYRTCFYKVVQETCAPDSMDGYGVAEVARSGPGISPYCGSARKSYPICTKLPFPQHGCKVDGTDSRGGQPPFPCR